jgi:hypothetical protein
MVKRLVLAKAPISVKRRFLYEHWAWLQAQMQTRRNDIVLSLDISKFSTGYTLLHFVTVKGKKEIVIVESGVIKGSDSNSPIENAKIFQDKIIELCEEYHPQIVGYEAISVAENFTGLKALAINQGVLLSSLGRVKDLNPIVVPVQNTYGKKLATSQGKSPYKNGWPAEYKTKKDAEKARVGIGVQERFDITFDSHDTTDAFLVGVISWFVSELARNKDYVLLSNSIDKDNVDDKVLSKLFKLKSEVFLNSLNLSFKKEVQEELLSIGLSILTSSVLMKENSPNDYKKTFQKIRTLFGYNATGGPSLEDSEDSDT